MADAATVHFIEELHATRRAVPCQFLRLHELPDGKGLTLRLWRPAVYLAPEA